MTEGKKSRHLADLYVLDIGQGDSLVFHLMTGELIVVDCHEPGSFAGSVLKGCLEKIADQRDNRYDIDLLCLTHPDADHYMGMGSLIDWIESKGGHVRNLIIPAVMPKSLGDLVTEEWERLKKEEPSEGAELPEALAKLVEKNKDFVRLYRRFVAIKKSIKSTGKVQRPNGFAHFKTFGATRVLILGPTSEIVDEYSEKVWAEVIRAWISEQPLESDSANEISSVLWLVTGQVQVLLTGDASASAMIQAIESYERHDKVEHGDDIRCDVVKASHHGSRTGSSPELWRKILKGSSFVAFSAGAHRGYGHPHRETIDDILSVPDSKPKLFCTNCLRYAEVGATSGGAPSVETDFLNDDDIDGRWSERPKKPDSTKFHGTIRFAIYDDGEIHPKPEIEPDPPCPITMAQDLLTHYLGA